MAERKGSFCYLRMMNYLDLFMGSLLLYGAIRGYFNGLIIEAATLAALLFGLLGGLLFSASVGDFLTQQFNIQELPPAGIVFALVFITIIVLVNLLARLLTKLLKLAALGIINRVLGAVFGCTKYALMISGILLLIDQFSYFYQFFDTRVLDESFLYEPVKAFGENLFSWLLNKKDVLPQQLV